MVFLSTSSSPDGDGSNLVTDRNDQSTARVKSRTTTGSQHHGTRGRVRACGVGAVLTLVAVAVTGCASNTTPTSSSSATSSTIASSTTESSTTEKTSSSTSYPAGKEQICQARDQLKTSITTLTDQGLLAAGTTAIKASVDQVQTDLDAVKAAGKQDYQAQVTNLQEALQQLQTAVGDLGNGDTAENLRAVGKAITLTGAAGEDLLTQLKTACG